MIIKDHELKTIGFKRHYTGVMFFTITDDIGFAFDNESQFSRFWIVSFDEDNLEYIYALQHVGTVNQLRKVYKGITGEIM